MGSIPARRSLLPWCTCCAYAVMPIRGLRMWCFPPIGSVCRPPGSVCRPPGVARSSPGRRDEGAEQPPVADHLGVPLHAEHEPAVRVLDRLGDAVPGAARDCELARVGNALVVVAVDADVGAHQPGDPTAGHEARL